MNKNPLEFITCSEFKAIAFSADDDAYVYLKCEKDDHIFMAKTVVALRSYHIVTWDDRILRLTKARCPKCGQGK